ncbi:MAG TPA: alpha/beta fold hydrolase [Reyranella sp.]|nr:alpha/beta fold hydrolase [Reyranella sp.]
MPSFLDIVAHTPLWVWPLLALVLWLGWWARAPRIVHPLRLAALPLVGLGVTLAGIVQSMAPALTLAGWLVGLLLSLPLGWAVGRRRAVAWQPDGRVWIDGGWFLLGFALSIFAARYALGVTFGVWPRLAAQPAWIAGAGAVGGAIAGTGLGWLTGLLGRQRRWLGRTLLAGAVLPPAALLSLAAVIAFSGPGAIPRLAAGDSIPGFAAWNRAEIPEVRFVAARDGAPLTYRLYPGRADRAVVLVHGSSGASLSMHKSAQALQAAGASVYAISLRGHGGSGTVNGDTSYLRQLDDDLVDFVTAVGLADAKAHRTLVGFSSGGGFVLRVASGRHRADFDAYLAVSPHIGQGAPTVKPNAGGWVSVAVPRLIGLSLLDAFGLPWFQDLPVIRFATDAAPSESRTPVYSFRLAAGLQVPRDWRAALARIDRPAAVVVGENDELFNAAAFQPLFAALNPRIAVTLQPGLGHLDMIADPRGTTAVAAVWQRLADSTPPRHVERFDKTVREDLFAGFDGDERAFARGLALIERTLAGDPDHAEALTWRGAARLFQAGEAFRRGATEAGLGLARQGIADMDRGVALKPGISTRAARAPVLMTYAAGLKAFDHAGAERLTRTALGDYELILEAERANWSVLAEHNRGEILGGLAQGWLQLDDAAKATPYLERLFTELPNTSYARAATVRRADPTSNTPLTCLGCH